MTPVHLPPDLRKRIATDEDVRIALATIRGLFRIEPLRRVHYRGKPGPRTRLTYCEEHHGGAATWAEVPNYPHDLNAVHALEAWLYDNVMDSDQWERYGKRLEDTHDLATILTRGEVDYHELAHLCHISARRRCDCLLDAFEKA